MENEVAIREAYEAISKLSGQEYYSLIVTFTAMFLKDGTTKKDLKKFFGAMTNEILRLKKEMQK